MPEPVSLSGALSKIAEHYGDLQSYLALAFSAELRHRTARYDRYSEREMAERLRERRDEVDLTSSLTVLGALEAAFRIDYRMRCERRKRDNVSRAFRAIYRTRRERASLEQEIFQAWVDNSSGVGRLIGELRGAFKFRHWLAHGRYWTPKLGRPYTFVDIYTLAELVLQSFPFFEFDQN